MSTEKVKIESELKPCPLCGEPVFLHKRPSRDGTIIWAEIMHGPTTGCGISFLDVEKDAIEKWNSRK
jgi:hypothetical protein